MEGDRSVGQTYKGPSGVGRDSQWLTWEDLPPEKDVNVTIVNVVRHAKVKFQGGRVRENMLSLHFKGASRELGLNATNRRMLVKMFGGLTDGWFGQKIALYIAQTQMAGETVNCVRIRDRGSVAAKAAESFLDEPAAATAATAPGDFQKAFNEGCRMLELGMPESAAILNRHAGDYEKAYADVSALVAKRDESA